MLLFNKYALIITCNAYIVIKQVAQINMAAFTKDYSIPQLKSLKVIISIEESVYLWRTLSKELKRNQRLLRHTQQYVQPPYKEQRIKHFAKQLMHARIIMTSLEVAIMDFKNIKKLERFDTVKHIDNSE